MLLFVVATVAILWISGCALGLALCAMLARADGREPRARPPRRPRADDGFARAERLLPMA